MFGLLVALKKLQLNPHFLEPLFLHIPVHTALLDPEDIVTSVLNPGGFMLVHIQQLVRGEYEVLGGKVVCENLVVWTTLPWSSL